jgi:hypothetical protein
MTAPKWKFRLLCKRCNSYRYTRLLIWNNLLRLRCDRCNVEADDLDEANEPNEWDVLLEDHRTKT